MNALTLRQLRYALALARAGHFGHAAELCAVTQPALSMQIRELEGALGVAIFDRSARRVRLTGFGTEFVARAAEILRAVVDLGYLARAADARRRPLKRDRLRARAAVGASARTRAQRFTAAIARPLRWETVVCIARRRRASTLPPDSARAQF